MKECGICGLRVESAKAEEHFYKSKRTKDGFEKNCKECKVALAREKRQAKKSKLEKNQKKKSAASPEKAVAEVVTPLASQGNGTLADKEKKVFGTSAADIINHAPRAAEQADTIKKNDYPVDLDYMVKKIFEQAGHPSVYEALEKRAHLEFRTPALQAIAIISEACD